MLQVYLEQITAMREVTEELRVKLGLDESGKVRTSEICVRNKILK